MTMLNISKFLYSLTPTLKVVFEEEMHGQSRYEELAECWFAALTRRRQALHILTLAQHEIKNLENDFSQIIGPDLVQYYHTVYYGDDDTSIGKLEADIVLDRAIPTQGHD